MTSSDSSMDDCNGDYGSVARPDVLSSDSSMDDCNAEKVHPEIVRARSDSSMDDCNLGYAIAEGLA